MKLDIKAILEKLKAKKKVNEENDNEDDLLAPLTPPRGNRKRLIIISVAAATVIAGGAGGYFMFMQTPPPPKKVASKPVAKKPAPVVVEEPAPEVAETPALSKEAERASLQKIQLETENTTINDSHTVGNETVAEVEKLIQEDTKFNDKLGDMLKASVENDVTLEQSIKTIQEPINLSKVDPFTLINEDFNKIRDLEKNLEQREQFMARVTSFLEKKRAYFEILKSFEKMTAGKTQDELFRESVEQKVNETKRSFESELASLKEELTKMKETKTATVVVGGSSPQEPTTPLSEEVKNQLKNELEQKLRDVQVYQMGGKLVAVAHFGEREIVVKKGDHLALGFYIHDITESGISLSNGTAIYHHDLMTQQNDLYPKVMVALPSMTQEQINYDEKEFEDLKKGNRDGGSQIEEYYTKEQREAMSHRSTVQGKRD